MTLYEVYRAAKLNAAIKFNRFRYRPTVNAALPISPVRQPKREFEVPWNEPGSICAHSPEPFPQIGADCSY
jgi:hypothetical protein